MSKKILITGGSGYIGSQTSLLFQEEGLQAINFDRKKSNFKHSDFRKIIDFQGDLLNPADLDKLFEKHPDISGVIHFAANIEVAESQKDPNKYYQNNFLGTWNLLDKMIQYGIKNLVFSSTAAVYGLPKRVPILETDTKSPINTYGRTKWMIEQMLMDYSLAYDFNQISLRYFNACGADLKARTGENHTPETHLIPIIFEVIEGKREFLQINGGDYNTPDGTCVRDYIHTLDLAKAHFQAMNLLLESKEKISESINLGTKNGYSIKQIVNTIKQITQKEFPIRIGPRRTGDPDKLVAENTKAKRLLNWEPEYSEIKTIIQSAWQWRINKENAYKS